MGTKPRIGLIGTGIMGAPMAANLLRGGHAVTVFSRTRARAAGLESAGADWADSPAAVASSAEVVISCVPDSPDVEAVYLSERGVCSGLRERAVCVDMSTISPATARAVAEAVESRGGFFLDAPVSGGKTGAEAGTLSIMVGGESSVLERVRPVLDAVGKSIVHCGPVGAGQLTKLCNQILCGCNLLGVCEALTFARSQGLDRETVIRAVSKGAAGSWALDNLGPRMITGDFAPMFMVDLQQKDLRITLEAGRDMCLPGTALVSQLLASNQAAGEGREGTQAMVKVIERLSHLAEEIQSSHES